MVREMFPKMRHRLWGLGIFGENDQSARAVSVLNKLHFSWLALLLLMMSQVSSVMGSPAAVPSAMATLSHRSAKPGEHLEIVVTVRSANHPIVSMPADMPGLRFKVLRKPRLLQVEGMGVWLFRYRVTPVLVGDYEIPPMRIWDESSSIETTPLYLHVTLSGERPPLSAKELSAGVNIPESLSEEVLKAAPQPTPKPTPSPSPKDNRDLGSRVGSTCWKGLRAFWNYQGK